MSEATMTDVSDNAPFPAAGPSLRVEARDIVKRYTAHKTETVALNGVSVSIESGQMAVLLGPSGCGKTTLLRSIAGLEQPQGGEIYLDGQCVYSAQRGVWVPPEKRRLSMVFQSYALWPHMSVTENVAYPLESRRVDRESTRTRVASVLHSVGLDGYGDRLPSQLSGGQQQRVALARAIVADVGVVLFDEPLSNVDAKVREEVRKQILDLQREYGFAGLYVTHDQVEAGALADVLVVMDNGRIAQVGRPTELYDAPVSRYVANFMGSANELPAKVAAQLDGGMVRIRTTVGELTGHASSDVSPTAGSEACIVFRPERAVPHHERPDGRANLFDARVRTKMFMGSHIELIVEVPGDDGTAELTLHSPRGASFQEGERIWVELPADAVRVLPQ